MAGQIRTQQFIRSIPYVPGGQTTIELPRMADLETLILGLQGTFTYPAGATGSLKSLGPQALIARIELVCDGKITVISAPGYKFGIASPRTFEGSGGGLINTMTPPAANAAGTIDTTMYVDCMQFDGVRPKDSNLRIRQFSVVELKITFSNWSECFTNVASAPTVYAVNLFVDGNYCTELDPANSKPSFVNKLSTVIVDATNSNSSYMLNLPAGNMIRSITAYTHVNGVASDSIINNVTVANGLDQRIQSSGRALKARVRGYKTPQPGHTEIDFARQTRGQVMWSNAWAIGQPAQPILTIDFTGQAGAKIELVINEYVAA